MKIMKIMSEKVLSLALFFCFIIGIIGVVSLITAIDSTAQTKEVRGFKGAEENSAIKTDMLKSREYRRAYNDIKASGRKGVSSREKTKVYPKQASAAEIMVNEKSRGGAIPRTLQVGAVFVDSGASSGGLSPVGIILIGTGKGNHKALKLMTETKDGKTMASLVDLKGKSVHEGQIEVLEKSPLKVQPNGTAIGTEKDEILIVISDKASGKTYALVVPSEVLVEVAGRMGSGSLEGQQ